MIESDDPGPLLRKLLAVLHGDAGGYAAEHGLRQATADAITKYNVMRDYLSKAQFWAALAGRYAHVGDDPHGL